MKAQPTHEEQQNQVLWESLVKARERQAELEAENALLKRALAMLTRSLENANEGGEY